MRRLLLSALLCGALPAQAVTPFAKEFVEIAKQLEPVHCEKRRLRREIALLEVERRDAEAKPLRERFERLNADPKTAKLEQRLGELERRMSDGRGGTLDREDLELVSRQHLAAYSRCQ